MADDGAGGLTRRALLAAAGGATAVAATGALTAGPAGAATIPGAPVPPLGPGDPVAGRGARARSAGLPPLAATPGLHHRMWGQYDVQPNYSFLGKVVSPTGAFCSASDGFLIAGLGLESDIVLTEVTFAADNSSGAAANGILEYNSFDGSQLGVALATVPIASGAADTIAFGTAAVDHRTSASNFYDASLFTKADGSVRIWGIRLSYVPNGYGLTPITPTRVYDSRPGNPPLGVQKGPLAGGTRDIDLLAGLSLPVVPRGVLVSVGVVSTSPSGFLSLFEAGTSWPGTSSVNWFVRHETAATTAYTDVDASGTATALVPSSSSTDFFIDVVGYYA
ncbi:MAG: hypothetical protein U0Q07_04300 [Acidimicrobiales bacterium]